MDKDLNPMTTAADTRGLGMKGILGTQLRRAALLAIGLVASMTVSAAETFEYIHTDALGSPVAVTDANGVVIERTVYEPYGAVVGGPVKDGPGYTGHVSDSATGLSYMQQRYMDPEIGAFLSVDPVTAYQQPVAQFGRYRYGNSNPYRNIDPDGRRACGADTGCQLEQGAYGGSLMVNTSEQERGARQAAALATTATNAANQALSSLAGRQYASTGAAGRAWKEIVRRVADKYDTEIASRFFYGEDGIVIGTATSDGLRHSVNPEFSSGPSPYSVPAGFVHTHPGNRLFSGNDLNYAVDQYNKWVKLSGVTGFDQSAIVSLSNGRVVEWKVSSFVKHGKKAYLNEEYYSDH